MFLRYGKSKLRKGVTKIGGDHAIYEQKPAECGEIIKEFIENLN